ncbi:unnamed protein product [Phaedon cochleariae]|uniref:Nucleolar protein 14 homolog n=1 Tax=Phaedon cochleariae TaxID=80249 RepID=A0A9N9X1Z5_PHACE|nr:unnamed protein product [Phaedon cochleariae]
MAKTKNKKVSSDQIHKKKEQLHLKKSMNPFEVHINKEKLKVIGKKQKNDRGLPGVSRAKALEKRKHTLLKEYKVQDKSNKFTDKRIGERNHKLTSEDKVMARFTAVRVKAHNKKSKFNLADDVVLTHRGQTLSEIEKFDDPRSDEDSLDEDESGKLDRDFVKEAHFGGGMLKKTGVEGAKSHKDLIDQLIAESKKRKAEKQKTKEATLELTEKLDSEWKDLIPLVNQKSKNDPDDVEKPQLDDYDKVMRELKFEARGTVSDRLKTEDEVAKEEKARLEKLENDRLERMQGYIDAKNPKQTHRSADDLDDDFIHDDDPEPDYTLSYDNEGKSTLQIEASVNGKPLTEAESSADEDNSIDEESEADSEDNLSDLKADSSDSESEEESKIEDNKTEESPVDLIGETKEDLQMEIKNDLLQRKEIMEKARQELPFTFHLPDSYETLLKELESQSCSHQCVIIERMIKCNHPSLAESNKENLGLLFAYLLQYFNDLFTDSSKVETIQDSFDIFKALVPQIYQLAQLNPENAHNSVLEVIKEKHEDYRKKPGIYPGLEVLVFLKLVSILFPTSDFRHQIVTPCFVFMEQMLNKCRVRNRRDISYGLFLCTLVLEYTTISQRYLPGVINFLAGLLHMAIPKTGVKLVKVPPPFKSTSTLLVLLENLSLSFSDSSEKCFQMKNTDLLSTEIDEEFKVRALHTAIGLSEEFYRHFEKLPSNVEIFSPIQKYLELVPALNYPRKVANGMENLSNCLNKTKSERILNYIVMEATRPKALRLYEPKIEPVYDGKRFKVQSREKREQSKLLHKLKSEKKGALREIRRDKAFLGRVKINQRIQSDKERIEKVKRIYAEASMQQSELNELDRKKKRKK